MHLLNIKNLLFSWHLALQINAIESSFIFVFFQNFKIAESLLHHCFKLINILNTFPNKIIYEVYPPKVSIFDGLIYIQ